MPRKSLIQFIKGLASGRSGETPSDGEPLWTTDTKKLYIGDGSTAGGIPATFIPTGGTADQVLTKVSATNYDLEWSTSGGGVTDHTLLSNIGTNTHAELDTHVADGSIHNKLYIQATEPGTWNIGDMWIKSAD